ncbi:hypothetical protein BOTBODRAFT_136370 [Botryobasidium botryosum FD-172 SS1]|uniref:Piwi domain-containing protein n=1 Tax=Botryobasidium botryosum (strain FD-172 SS1) TaxID=930990 RepID=A0A067M561_BOTB1|nr:hypothetical protein BOTBODRAFT_136370 [Botryobasidium botryosum FD-172 SS1]
MHRSGDSPRSRQGRGGNIGQRAGSGLDRRPGAPDGSSPASQVEEHSGGRGGGRRVRGEASDQGGTGTGTGGRGTRGRGDRGARSPSRFANQPGRRRDRGSEVSSPPPSSASASASASASTPASALASTSASSPATPNPAPDLLVDDLATLEPRFTDSTLSDLVTLRKTWPPGALPMRRTWGTRGKQTVLRANYFGVTFPDNLKFYAYSVHIEPKPGSGTERRAVWARLQALDEWVQYQQWTAWDGTERVFSAKVLPESGMVFRIGAEGAGTLAGQTGYTVSLIREQDITTDLLRGYLNADPGQHLYDPLPTLSVLNIIFAQYAARNGGIRIGRSKVFFDRGETENLDLGGGLEALKGYFSSVRPTYTKLMVNVNVSTAAFHKAENLAAALREHAAGGGANVNAMFRGVQVETAYRGYRKTHKIFSVLDTLPRATFFPTENAGQVSVYDYFHQKYEPHIPNDHDFETSPVVNLGTTPRPILVPSALCSVIPNQPFRGKLTDTQTRNMLTYASRPPARNRKMISEDGMTSLGYAPARNHNQDQDRDERTSPLKEFGISVEREMLVVPARILPPPVLSYANRDHATAGKNGSWTLHEQQLKFYIGAELKEWGVLVIPAPDSQGPMLFSDPTDPRLMSIIEAFRRVCADGGMNLDGEAFPHIVFAQPFTRRHGELTSSITAGIHELQKQSTELRIVLVMLSNKDSTVYSTVKYECDTQLDVHTVCVRIPEIIKKKPEYLANVALKFNMKLGGVNHTLDATSSAWLKRSPTMLMGADVTHPSPKSQKGKSSFFGRYLVVCAPSIAAVVGSTDDNFSQYPASMRLQIGPRASLEMIQELGDMVAERLACYRARSHDSQQLPKRIIIFRDGVAESQFRQVVDTELPKIQKAFEQFGTAAKPYRPKVSIIVAGKRHHTRFYPVDKKGADKDTGNPRPGTVVDKGVTAVYDADFFLQAHAGIHGTAKPTHYYPVYDENKLTADELQVLTHNISYLYARATKAVSLAPPAYYSDLACERGRCYLHELMNTGGNPNQAARADTAWTKADEEAERQRVFQKAVERWGEGVGPTLRETMFYL